MIDFDDLPLDWNVHRLADLCEIRLGKTPARKNPAYWGGSLPWASISDLNNSVLTATKEGITQLAACECNCKPIAPGTLLFSFKLTIGKQSFAGVPLYTNEAIAALPVKSGVALEPRFLSLALKVVPLLDDAADAAKGLTLNKDSLAAIRIPVPPIAEQRRLVARIEALTSRINELRSVNASLLEDAIRLLAAEYGRICDEATTMPFGTVAKLVRRRVETKPTESYSELGIRSFGKGTFHKPAVTRQQLGNKRIFRIHPGDLVFMNVFAWEGAIAVAKPEDKDRVGSHRFMTYEVLTDRATPEFLCYHFLTDYGLEQIRAASPGSAGRNRTLGITKLHAIPIPLPAIEAQRRFSMLHAIREKLRGLQTEAERELAALTAALLAKAFRRELHALPKKLAAKIRPV